MIVWLGSGFWVSQKDRISMVSDAYISYISYLPDFGLTMVDNKYTSCWLKDTLLFFELHIWLKKSVHSLFCENTMLAGECCVCLFYPRSGVLNLKSIPVFSWPNRINWLCLKIGDLGYHPPGEIIISSISIGRIAISFLLWIVTPTLTNTL